MLASLFPSTMLSASSSSSSSEVQQTQRRKRQSPTPSTVPRHRSCEGCRLRKLKCSRTEDCVQCQKRGATCVWIGSAPSRSAEEATLEASEAEVVRLNQVIKQLEARIVKLEAGQQQQPVPTPTPAATTTPSVAPVAPLTIASPDPSLAASALDNFSIASPRGEPLRPSTASSRASSFEPLEQQQQQQQQATPMAYAAAAPFPPSAAASYLVSAPSSTSAAGRYASTAPQPQPRGGQPTASLYSVDSSFGAAPSLSPSSSVTSFASSFQTMEHHPDARFLYNGPPGPSSSSYAAPPQPHIYQHHQGYPAVVEQRHWSQEEQQVKIEHHQHQQQGQWAASPPPQFADVHGRVVYQHQQQHSQQRWHS